MLEQLNQHARYAARSLRQSPSFTIVAALTLALGVGSATAVFGVLSAAFLRPLPYREPDRLIAISETKRGDEISVSYPNFLDWRAGSRSFSEIAAFASRALVLGSDAGAPERIRGQVVTSNLFRTLGVMPTQGRAFSEREDERGTERVAIIGNGLWQRRFASDPAIVGKTIVLDRNAYTVVGVMPDGFDFPGGLVYGAAEIWLPLGLAVDDDMMSRQSHPGLGAIGRLRARATLASARAELTAIAARLREQYPASNREQSVKVQTALDGIVGELRPGLTLVAGAVALLLLITCANVAGLFLARAVARHREIAIRSALGASRGRVVTQLVVESLLLAVTGGAAGLLLAWWGVRLIVPVLSDLPRLATAAVDWRVASFAIVITLLTGIVYGVAPAFIATGESIDRWLRERGRSTGAVSQRIRRLLVGGEIALSLTLVVGAALLGRSFANLRAAPGGIDPEGVLTFEMRVPESSGTGASVARFYASLVERLQAIPGVLAVGGISTLPFTGGGSQSGMRPLEATDESRTDVAVVTPQYFRAMGVELLRGRTFSAADDSAAPKVAVVDERLAKKFWPNADAIGQRLEGWGFQELTVVGVVRHVKNYGVAAESREELFVAHAQRPSRRLIMAVRARHDDAQLLAESVRRAVAELDRSLPVYNVRTMDDVVSSTIAAPRLSAAVSGVVAALALVLATVGLYGVLSFTVSQRRHEIGVRMALGAAPRAVAGMIVRQALLVAVGGIVVGIGGATLVVRLVKSQLFGVAPADPTTVVIAAVSFLIVTAFASWVPARRAAGVSPVTALRDE
ncbi:MAG TPA: ABC transporter permease [Gemmatimonadaceae bacterium]|nr:ABC transporter permease [Gemmatimonadaceae bacterium]